MEGNEMDIFDSEGLELNIDATPEDLGLVDEENTEENTGDESTEENVEETTEENTNESSEEDEDSSEEVASEDEDEGGDENSPNLYSSLASVLHEQGLLPSLDLDSNEVKNIDDITTAFKSEIEANVKQRLVETLGEDGYEAVTNGVPLSELAKVKDNQTALESITDDTLQEDPELAKRVIYQDYINQGMSEDRAKRLLKRIVDAGDDAVLEDAAESLQSLKAYEQRQIEVRKEEFKKQQELVAKQQEEVEKQVKDKIYNSNELLKGMKLNKAIKDKVYKSMTEIVGKNQDGVLENRLMRDRRTNPVEFDTKLYYLYELTNGFQDFTKISNTTKTSAISDLERSIRQTNHQDTGTPGFLQDGESYSGFGDEIVL
jgi:hypothetical protein